MPQVGQKPCTARRSGTGRAEPSPPPDKPFPASATAVLAAQKGRDRRGQVCEDQAVTESTEPGWSVPRLCAPPGEIAVLDSAGFVVAPGSMYPAQNPQVCTIPELSPVECLVLLGDPGIGKSTVLAAEQRRLTDDGKEFIAVDLADIADFSDLTTQLFARPTRGHGGG